MMTPKNLQSRLPWKSRHPSGIGGRQSAIAFVLALAMGILIVLGADEAPACRDSTVQGTITAVEEMQTVAKIATRVIRAVPPGMDLQKAHEISDTGTEGNALGCCGTLHASGSGCSGANCASCSAAAVPTAIAAYVPGATSGCPWSRGTSVAALSPASLFRPPRLDV